MPGRLECREGCSCGKSLLVLKGRAEHQQPHDGILLLLSGEGKPITCQTEVLNSLFCITCLKAAGEIKTSKRMMRAQPKPGRIQGNHEKFSD